MISTGSTSFKGEINEPEFGNMKILSNMEKKEFKVCILGVTEECVDFLAEFLFLEKEKRDLLRLLPYESGRYFRKRVFSGHRSVMINLWVVNFSGDCCDSGKFYLKDADGVILLFNALDECELFDLDDIFDLMNEDRTTFQNKPSVVVLGHRPEGCSISNATIKGEIANNLSFNGVELFNYFEIEGCDSEKVHSTFNRLIDMMVKREKSLVVSAKLLRYEDECHEKVSDILKLEKSSSEKERLSMTSLVPRSPSTGRRRQSGAHMSFRNTPMRRVLMGELIEEVPLRDEDSIVAKLYEQYDEIKAKTVSISPPVSRTSPTNLSFSENDDPLMFGLSPEVVSGSISAAMGMGVGDSRGDDSSRSILGGDAWPHWSPLGGDSRSDTASSTSTSETDESKELERYGKFLDDLVNSMTNGELRPKSFFSLDCC